MKSSAPAIAACAFEEGVISQSIFWCGFTSSRNGRRVELWHEKNEGHHVAAAGVVQATDGSSSLVLFWQQPTALNRKCSEA